jgi:hypothetical protein
MATHYEAIVSVPGKISRKKICGIALNLFLKMCVNIADLTVLSLVGGVYVDNEIACFHILKRE